MPLPRFAGGLLSAQNQSDRSEALYGYRVDRSGDRRQWRDRRLDGRRPTFRWPVRSAGKFQYPGIPTTCDGAEAVVWVETRISQGCGAFPITSSTTMGGGFNQAVVNGVPNLWGDQLVFVEPESEHSSASFCEGFAAAGGRVTNFTSGQGLVLMKEVLYTIAGKRLPAVFNIGARALTSQGLNVHAGHDDVMSVADCGWGMLFARNAQEAGDLCLIARRAAEASHTPFFNVQDGFLTTHTVESVRLIEPEFMREFVGNPKDKLMNLMDPANPMMSGVVQNQDSYMKGKIAQRWYYDQVEPALAEAFEEFYRKTGRRYDFVMPYRCEDAEYILVGMGCYMETAQTTVDWLREEKGIKAGCLNVYCFRPFPATYIVDALKHAKAITVIERMDDPLSTTGNHLTREIKAAFCDAITGQNGQEQIDRVPKIYHGAAGLGSRDVRPGDIYADLREHDRRRAGLLQRRDQAPHGAGGEGGSRSAAAGRVFDARPFDRRLRLGDDEQGDRHDRRAGVRQGRAGVSEVRLGEEGPADDVLSHDRRLAHLFAQRAGVRRPRRAQRHDGAVQRQSAGGPGRRAGRSSCRARITNPVDVWQRIPTRDKNTIREKNLRVFFIDMVQIAREVASRGRLADADAGHRAVGRRS